jgi:hypothetical protein
MSTGEIDDNRPLLFSIHGIRTNGPWQEGANVVLNAFYDHEAIKYSEFKKWAILKLAADMITLLVGAIIIFCLWEWNFVHGRSLWPLYFIFLIVVVLTIGFFADRSRGKVIDQIYCKISEKSANRIPPHIIAHSLGSFLSAKALQKYQGLSYKSVILNGCVLKRRFPWNSMRLRFEQVTNEVGRKDPVPYTAAVLGLFVEDMGAAGALGFKHEDVHNHSPEEEYPNCRAKRCPCDIHADVKECQARVHNVHHEGLAHSDFFVGLIHAWYFWLPTLLGYDPVLYRQFQNSCMLCYKNETDGALPDVQDEAVENLKNTCWGFTRGKLKDFVKSQIRKRSSSSRSVSEGELDDATDFAISVTWENVALAAQETHKPSSRDENLIRQLEPRRAISSAIDSVAATIPWMK